MTSGDNVLHLLEIAPPATLFATPDEINGGSTPAEKIPCWDFDDTSAEYLDFRVLLDPNYSGGGLTLTLPWSSGAATSGQARLGAAFRRIADDAEDLNSSHSYAYNDSSETTASAAGEVQYSTITFTDGADMDNLAAGEIAILRIRRAPTHGDDDLVGDVELHLPFCKET